MSWYYAGPAGKPVGPVIRGELQAKRAEGSIAPETYILENTGQAGAALAWKRYREVFPDLALPPIAPVPTQPAHPLFPSASLPHRVPASPASDEHRTNPWCLWGMILGVGSLPMFALCGLGILVAPIAFVVCLIGIIQVQGRRNETGWGLGAIGIIFSGLGMLLTLVLLIWLVPLASKYQEQTTTEQSTNDSD